MAEYAFVLGVIVLGVIVALGLLSDEVAAAITSVSEMVKGL